MKDAVNTIKYGNPGAIAVTVEIDTANVAAGTVMEVTGDLTADKAAAGSTKVLGRLVKEPSAAGEKQAVVTPFVRVATVPLAETVVAGDHGKIGSDGASNEQRFAKWDRSADKFDLNVCMFLQGGDENDTVLAGFWR